MSTTRRRKRTRGAIPMPPEGDSAGGGFPAPMTAGPAGAMRRLPETLTSILKWGLCMILAICPLPLASVRPLAGSLLAIGSGLLLLIAVACEFRDPAPRERTSILRWPMIFGAGVVLWSLMQTVPSTIPGWYPELWNLAAQAIPEKLAPSISVFRERSIAATLGLLSYAAIFLVAWRVGRDSVAAKQAMRVVALAGSAYAVYGLIVYFDGNRSILWFPKWAYQYDLTSTFINRNSFATYMGLCLVVVTAFLAEIISKNFDARSRRTALQSVIESIFWNGRWPTMGMVIIGSALLLTHSRGGLISTTLGMAALVGCAIAAPSLRGPWRGAFASAAIGGCLILAAINGSGLVERAAHGASEAFARGDIYAGTLAAIRDNSIFGTGLATFEFVFPPYQPQSFDGFVNLAHNDYLENALELGVPAAVILYIMLAMLIARCAIGLVRRRRDAILPCMGVAASVLVGVHSLVDFSMQIPAVAVTYAALLGIGVAQSSGSGRPGGESPRPQV